MIDTHCHLTDAVYENKLDTIIKHCIDSGLTHMISCATDLTDCQRVVFLADRYSLVWGALGFSPPLTKLAEMPILDDLKLLIKSYPGKIVAIGEIGLDYHWVKDEAVKKQQRELFAQQLQLAIDENLPVIVHSRNALADALAEIKNFASRGLRGVIHSFVGTMADYENIVEINFKISVNGIITYPTASKELLEVCRSHTSGTLILETDSPYLVPTGLGSFPNYPYNLGVVAKKVAELREETTAELVDSTTQTAKQLFNLHDN